MGKMLRASPALGTPSSIQALRKLPWALKTMFWFLIAVLAYGAGIQFCVNYRCHFAMAPPCPTVSPPPLPLKVFMYDLPWKFHKGILPRKLDAWFKQHTVEYWLMESLLQEGGGTEAVRVTKPELAEAFFLPFFSSMSFIHYSSHNMTGPMSLVDRQLQVDALGHMKEFGYWNRSGGSDHVIPMHHPNSFRFHRDQLSTAIWIVADFGRYPRNLANLRKDVVAPYNHLVDTMKIDDSLDPFASRQTLLFFRGKTARKDEGKVRLALRKELMMKYDDVIYEENDLTDGGIQASTGDMRRSRFCLHAAGDTPSSCRLFDAIVSHCVPVIVSDHIELPFEDELEYSKFSMFFSANEAIVPGFMVLELRKVSKERWVQMWRHLKAISHHFEYQSPTRNEDAVNMIWRQVKYKIREAKLASHRSKRLKIPDWWC